MLLVDTPLTGTRCRSNTRTQVLLYPPYEKTQPTYSLFMTWPRRNPSPLSPATSSHESHGDFAVAAGRPADIMKVVEA